MSKVSASEIERRIKASEKAQKLAYHRQLDSQVQNTKRQSSEPTPKRRPSPGSKGRSVKQQPLQETPLANEAPGIQRPPPSVHLHRQIQISEAERKAQYRRELEVQMLEQKLRKISAELEFGGSVGRNLEQEIKDTKKQLKALGYGGDTKETLKNVEQQIKREKTENEKMRQAYNSRAPIVGGATGGSGEPLRGPDGQILSDYTRIRAHPSYKVPKQHTSVKEALTGYSDPSTEVASVAQKSYAKPSSGKTRKQAERTATAGKRERSKSGGVRKKMAGGSKDRKGSKPVKKTGEWWEHRVDLNASRPRPPSRQIPTLKRLGFDPSKSQEIVDQKIDPDRLIQSQIEIGKNGSPPRRFYSRRPSALPRTPPEEPRKQDEDLPPQVPPPDATYDNFEKLKGDINTENGRELEDSEEDIDPLDNSSELVNVGSRPGTISSTATKKSSNSRGRSATSNKSLTTTHQSTSVQEPPSSSDNDEVKGQPYSIMHKKPKQKKSSKIRKPDSAKQRSGPVIVPIRSKNHGENKPEAAKIRDRGNDSSNGPKKGILKKRKDSSESLDSDDEEDPDKVVDQFLNEHKRKTKTTFR